MNDYSDFENNISCRCILYGIPKHAYQSCSKCNFMYWESMEVLSSFPVSNTYVNTTIQKSGLLRSALVCKSCHNFYFDLWIFAVLVQLCHFSPPIRDDATNFTTLIIHSSQETTNHCHWNRNKYSPHGQMFTQLGS